MGNFVNESENQEMKDFFWGKIFPCSQDTIRQSELLSSICQLLLRFKNFSGFAAKMFHFPAHSGSP